MEKTYRLQQDRPTLWTPMYIRLGIATTLLSFVEQMITVNMPLYMEDLGATPYIIGVVVSAFSFSSMFVRFLAGHAMDRKGRLAVGLFGLYLTLIPLAGFVLFPVVWLVICLRFVQGVGFSCASLSQGTMSVDIPAPEKKDEGTGYYGLFYSVATMFGPAAGLAISARWGYRELFFFCILIFALLIALTYTLNYEKRRGTVYQRPDPAESAGGPLLDRLIEKKALPAAAVCLFTSGAYTVVSSFMAVFAKEAGVAGTGTFFAVVAAFTFIGRLVSGRMIARKKRVLALLLGNLMMFLGMLILAAMTNVWQMMLGGFLFGLGGGYAWPALAILAVTDAELNRRGTANSTYYAAYDLGMAAGGLLGGMVADAAGYRALFFAGVAVFAFATVLTAAIFPKRLAQECRRGA